MRTVSISGGAPGPEYGRAVESPAPLEPAPAHPAAAHRGGLLALLVALIEGLRPRQWAKNVFVFAGLVFGGHLLDPSALLAALLAFAAFCAAASAVYLCNDAADREADARHPKKRTRPIASGRLPVSAALAAAAALAAGALALAAHLSRAAGALTLVYLALSAAYSLRLKRVFLLDALIVASGFSLRAAMGAAAVHAEISQWLLCCTFLLALFLVLGKRRQELRLFGEEAVHGERPLGRYTAHLVDGWLTALSGATIVAYALYTQAERTVEHFHTTALVYTVPFVVYALFRYQALVATDDLGADPTTAVLGDRGIVLAVLGWGAAVAAIIYS
jgi:4-hydroxybenzoate polyprenyltransferase